ncbi:MAG: hypothetical protein LQ342_006049 [Letrouitia transgressa]|nr:MAG: hypothetical protein LQ342_006049 [Letrouitia transgressa]
MTRRHTDLYLRKSFSLLEDMLDPDTVFFLGDLFDGGREWLPPNLRITDNPWQAYGQDYWLKEYSRFGRIYFDRWHRGTQSRKPHQHGRKIIASLPGNHDLGLGTGIKNAVRSRFNAYFGDGNRIDMIGNHTFVSLDTVSLSAKGQPDPMTGQPGKPEGDDFNRKLWGPTDDFLTGAKAMKERLIAREIRLQHGQPETNKLFHEALDINDPIAHKLPNRVSISQPDIPSIILTHVPLYRAKGTPCGPLREHFPPSKVNVNDGEAIIDNDPPNAIKVEQGVQYQNVLTPYVSHEIIERVGDVAYAFSGDDHDYCDVVHRGYTSRWGGGGVRETTVKSTSWAMGIRRPGFLMVSLWNPLETSGVKASSAAEEGDGSGNGEMRRGGNETLQTHLCLLPDQLGIFIRYAVFFVLTVIGLFIRSIVVVVLSPSQLPWSYFENANGHVLPMGTPKTQIKTKDDPPPPLLSPTTFAHSSVSARSESPNANANANGLAARASGRLRGGGSPSRGYALPAQRDMMHADPLDERWGNSSGVADAWIDRGQKRKTEKGLGAVWREFMGSFVQVAGVGFGWWVWLVWRR